MSVGGWGWGGEQQCRSEAEEGKKKQFITKTKTLELQESSWLFTD